MLVYILINIKRLLFNHFQQCIYQLSFWSPLQNFNGSLKFFGDIKYIFPFSFSENCDIIVWTHQNFLKVSNHDMEPKTRYHPPIKGIQDKLNKRHSGWIEKRFHVANYNLTLSKELGTNSKTLVTQNHPFSSACIFNLFFIFIIFANSTHFVVILYNASIHLGSSKIMHIFIMRLHSHHHLCKFNIIHV